MHKNAIQFHIRNEANHARPHKELGVNGSARAISSPQMSHVRGSVNDLWEEGCKMLQHDQ